MTTADPAPRDPEARRGESLLPGDLPPEDLPAGELLPEDLLPEHLLAAFRERAAVHDRENTFPEADLAALRERGYLRLLVPVELGGLGASLLEAGRIQRRLAQAAPATALSMNMHLVVTGAALHALRVGAPGAERAGAERLLSSAARGELLAFGISEPGNEAMLFDSATSAVADADGGYSLSGTKIFTSLAPVWDRLVVHARVGDAAGASDLSDLSERSEFSESLEPELVFGTIVRTDRVETLSDWDTHGMRATQSRTTRLHGARLEPADVITRTSVGPNTDPFVMGVFGAFELLLASVYTGVAERALELGQQTALHRRSVTRGIVHADDPDIRWRLADAAIGLDGSVLQIEKLLADLDALGTGARGPGVRDHGPRWFLQLSGVKSRTTETAIRTVDQVLRASGGAHFSRSSELERLSRDVRAGLYHPSDEESVHSSYAKALLGEIGAPREE
ncbi:acyl-CoA dehydrogenase [Brachybacterium endophyticum]|uniref:Acyl-CoA dehydrogenase n=1 Tax=Brachybacterium endophyticum TaxID=2182385 RepID=A0A2U2RLQ4_9MICO|nr:acyl-CoA dehydrogenase family protein [Brachybacterium endophyticum]PWH06803.1 acyl-CoA dehydrogenase [Brachybacterium endophyticum]